MTAPHLLLVSPDGRYSSTVGSPPNPTSLAEAIEAMSQGSDLLIYAGTETIPNCAHAPACSLTAEHTPPCEFFEGGNGTWTQSYRLRVVLRDGNEDAFTVQVVTNGRIVVETFQCLSVDTAAETINCESKFVQLTADLEEKLRLAVDMTRTAHHKRS